MWVIFTTAVVSRAASAGCLLPARWGLMVAIIPTVCSGSPSPGSCQKYHFKVFLLTRIKLNLDSYIILDILFYIVYSYFFIADFYFYIYLYNNNNNKVVIILL